VFENRVLRKICGRKRDEVTGDYRKLHTNLLLSKYDSSDKIKKDKKDRKCGAREGEEKCLQDFDKKI
jgi:hypothetical protein